MEKEANEPLIARKGTAALLKHNEVASVPLNCGLTADGQERMFHLVVMPDNRLDNQLEIL